MSSDVHVPSRQAAGSWVELARNMQQEGVASVLLPLPASRFRSPVLPCMEAPLGESIVLYAAAGAVTHGFRWSSCAGRGWRGWGWGGQSWNNCRAVGPAVRDCFNNRLAFALLRSVYSSGLKTSVFGDGKSEVLSHRSGGVRNGKSSAVTAGGEYTEDTSKDSPWLAVDASLKQRGEAGECTGWLVMAVLGRPLGGWRGRGRGLRVLAPRAVS